MISSSSRHQNLFSGLSYSPLARSRARAWFPLTLFRIRVGNLWVSNFNISSGNLVFGCGSFVSLLLLLNSRLFCINLFATRHRSRVRDELAAATALIELPSRFSKETKKTSQNRFKIRGITRNFPNDCRHFASFEQFSSPRSRLRPSKKPQNAPVLLPTAEFLTMKTDFSHKLLFASSESISPR
jgi:hypothetical protein